MADRIQVNHPPPKPLMVYDGDCNFCKLWIARWRQLTGEAVDYLPSQDRQITARFPEIPPDHFQTAVHLIDHDGNVSSGAEAVFRALAENSRKTWALKFYKASKLFAGFTECAYQFIAGHRATFSLLTRLLWGRHVERPEYRVARWIFLRALGLIYLVAFISLWTQIAGLIGHNGILPEDQYMAGAKQYFDNSGAGLDRFRELPTLCWLNSSDGFLQFQCAAGVVFAFLLIVGVAPVPALAILWLLYLSLTTVGRDFLGFQWDNLLLETGFLAIFFAPLQWLPGFTRERPPSRLVLWLIRILLFKLMFSSGCVKLASGDPNWRNLTALTFHYQTQPLPTWIAWYTNLFPLWFQKTSCAVMFAVELGAPFLIFLPRRIRFIGGGALASLQVLILLTGNYTFFNWLTLALCLLLLDDFLLKKLAPRFLKQSSPANPRFPWLLGITIPLAAIFVSVSLFQIVAILGVKDDGVFKPVAKVASWIDPFRTVSNYGLFAVMTTERHEIIVQGSNDGVNWRDYEFKYKPGNLNERPVFIAPFQPRLDWQMWFAALGNYQENPWFQNFCVRLLQGAPQVLALLKDNPFPGKPPQYIRAELYNYEFTSFNERRASGAWWKRQFIGEYLPAISLTQ